MAVQSISSSSSISSRGGLAIHSKYRAQQAVQEAHGQQQQQQLEEEATAILRRTLIIPPLLLHLAVALALVVV